MEEKKRRFPSVFKSGAFISFATGVVLYILLVLPILINDKGVFTVNGDYNYQSLPFTLHIRDMILSGNVVWDWSNGLGGQFLSSYAYYNLFSPFSALYLFIPRGWVIYAIPYVTALKYGVGCMLAYFYIKRFTSSPYFAVIGGILYMFSSFNAFNVVFHFIDIIALFPLLLISLEELCVNKRRMVFCLTAALMALVNYYFFFGQALFCVIYYFVRYFDKSFPKSAKQFFSVAAEGFLGVMLSAAVLLPVVFALMDSQKANAVMSVSDYFVYTPYTYLKIVQSFFMLPDPFMFASLFPETQNVYPYGTLGASLAAYIPLFSCAGVISYAWARRKAWHSILLMICAVMMLVPVLNQLFSALNSAYYVRWIYMPLLIGCMVSVKALDDGISLKPGILVCGGMIALLIGYQIIAQPAEQITRYSSRPMISTPQNILHFSVTIIGLAVLIAISRMKRDKDYFPKLYILSIICCYMVYGVMLQYSYSTGFGESELVAEMNAAELPEEVDPDERMCFKSKSTQNYNHIWNGNSSCLFNSIIDSGYYDFMDLSGYKTLTNVFDSTTYMDTAIHSVTSTRYLFAFSEKGVSEYGWTPIAEYADYIICENENYIPMGFTYDSVMSEEDFMSVEDVKERQRLYLRALVVDDTSEFSDILPVCENTEPVSDEEYKELVQRRRESAAVSCKKTTKGLDAEITLEKENIVFFSASYNSSWSAFVDEQPAALYKVNSGMIGVRVPEGTHSVSLRYSVRGFGEGCVVSAGAAALFAVYAVLTRKKKILK